MEAVDCLFGGDPAALLLIEEVSAVENDNLNASHRRRGRLPVQQLLEGLESEQWVYAQLLVADFPQNELLDF